MSCATIGFTFIHLTALPMRYLFHNATLQSLRLHTHHPLRQPPSAPGKIPAFIGPHTPSRSGESADQHGVHPSTRHPPPSSPREPPTRRAALRLALVPLRGWCGRGGGAHKCAPRADGGQPQDLPIAAGGLRAKCRCAEKLGRWRFRGFSSPHGRFGRARGVLSDTPLSL